MKCTDHMLLKVSILMCILSTGKVAAQTTASTTPAQPQVTLRQHTDFNCEAGAGFNQALTSFFAQQQLAESKIQKRIRKKKDPILIPYALNKKSFSLS